MEAERQRKAEGQSRRKISDDHKKENNNEKRAVGSSGLAVGDGVKSARLHERNPRKVVLTMYQVTGNKGWGGKQLWVPNIKLPQGAVYYDVIEE